MEKVRGMGKGVCDVVLDNREGREYVFFFVVVAFDGAPTNQIMKHPV